MEGEWTEHGFKGETHMEPTNSCSGIYEC